jgi:hypothetical protein
MHRLAAVGPGVACDPSTSHGTLRTHGPRQRKAAVTAGAASSLSDLPLMSGVRSTQRGPQQSVVW